MDSDSLKVLHEAVKSRYDYEIERIKRLDDKANNVMGIAGILTTLVSGFASLSLKVSSLSVLEILVIVTFFSSLALLLVAFGYGIKAHQVRKFLIIPDPPLLLNSCAEMKADAILETLIENYSKSVEENQVLNDGKADDIKMAHWFVLCSLVLFSFFALLIIGSR